MASSSVSHPADKGVESDTYFLAWDNMCRGNNCHKLLQWRSQTVTSCLESSFKACLPLPIDEAFTPARQRAFSESYVLGV